MTTLDQTRKYANGMVPNSTVAAMLRSLAEQVETLTAERDAAREAVISNCARVMTVTTERDALKDAARLALDALDAVEIDEKHYLTKCSKAIAALKAVL